MFSLEVKVDEQIPVKQEFPVPLSVYSLSSIKIWKLMTTVFSQLTWDVPVLHPTRSNVVLILALPPNFSYLELISFVEKSKPLKHFSIYILKHYMNSAVIEFENQADADKFYIRSLGTPFDRNFPHVNCILLFIYKVCSLDSLPIVPIKTIKETEMVEFELPVCPICFKLFDPLISGYFSSCSPEDVSDETYAQWGCPECQVCKTLHRPENFQNMHCMCGERSKLWICMQCGHVGCERDANRHAIEHYLKTQHRFAYRVDKMWLWDYLADRSVDRSFHAPPTTNEQIVESYKDMLIESIMELQAKEDEESMELDQRFGAQIRDMKDEEAKLNAEIEALSEEYKESMGLQNELQGIMNEINVIKKKDPMTKLEALEKANSNYKNELSKLEEKQKDLFRKLEMRKDVTDQVVLDF